MGKICLTAAIFIGFFYFIWAKKYWKEKDCEGEWYRSPCTKNFFLPGVYLIIIKIRKIFHLKLKQEKYEKLRRMYVGKEEPELFCIYYSQMGAMMVGVLLFGLLILAAACVLDNHVSLLSSYYLERQGVAGGTKNVSLEADNGVEKKEITIHIPEKEYTPEQRKKAFIKVKKKVINALPGENTSLEKINKPLVLLKKVSGYAIDITWELGKEGLVKEDGSLQNDNLTEPVQTDITAILSYGEEEQRVVQMLTIYPQKLTTSQRFWNSWESQWKELEKGSRTKDYVQLPEKVAGKILHYEEQGIPVIFVIMAGIVMILLFVPVIYQSRITGGMNKRREQLHRDYPEFVEHFVLLIGAGLTVKGTWERMVKDYENRGGEQHYVYEEMKLALGEMDCGMSETRAYELFGKRTGLLSYMKFCTLIVQNLRKGSSDLLHLLDYEVTNAFHERKENAKELGEKAGTKLLLPMVVMLALVFVIILYAAFQSM